MAWASAGAWNRPRSGGWQSGAVSPRVFAFDFLANTALPAAISLSRATTGTRFNSSGNLATEAINAARFDYVFNGTIWVPAGLRSEEQRTNLVPTKDFSSWTASAVTVSGGAASPDGATNAFTAIPTTSFGPHRVTGFGALSFSITGPTVFSVFAKANGYTQFGVREDQSTGSSAVFTLTGSGAVFATTNQGSITISNATITRIGSGSYWVSMLLTPTGTITVAMGLFSMTGYTSGDPAGYGFAGDGTSGAIIYGPQAEIGGFLTSYISTSGAAVTRSADLLSSNAPLTGYLAAGPSILEATDLATGTTSRTAYAAGAFTWPQNQLYRLLAVYQPGTNTSGYLTVGGPY